MVFIKTEIILSLKFCPKFNRIPHQHLSKIDICHIIYFLKKKNLKIKKIKKFYFFI